MWVPYMCLSVCLLLCLMSPLLTTVILYQTLIQTSLIYSHLSGPQVDGSRRGRGDGSYWQTTVCIILNTLLYVNLLYYSSMIESSDINISHPLCFTAVTCVSSSACFQDKEPRGIIPLENLSIREVDDSKKPVSFPSFYSHISVTLW